MKLGAIPKTSKSDLLSAYQLLRPDNSPTGRGEVIRMKKQYFSSMFFIVLVAVVLFATNTYSAVLEVGAGKAYATIQSAINDAGTGDNILVYDLNQ